VKKENEILGVFCLNEDGTEFKVNIKELLEKEEEEKEDEKCCLITHAPLKENFVELECGHTFNYVPLFKEIVNQKRLSCLDNHKLSLYELRCPYCRNKQKKLLPYYEGLAGVEKKNGINWIDETIFYNLGVCEFKNANEPGNNAFMCHNNYVKKMQDGNTYCYFHMKFMQKELKKAEEKAKKLEKLQAKEAEKKAKKLEKLQAKEAEKKAKEEAKNMNQKKKPAENVVLETKCQVILKTGLRQGEKCGLGATKECMCTRHYNLHKKSPKLTIE
jgi:hypothetical protein